MSFLGCFNAEAIAADSQGLNCLRCSHCGGWNWTEKTQAMVDAGVRTWCGNRACEDMEGVMRAIPGWDQATEKHLAAWLANHVYDIDALNVRRAIVFAVADDPRLLDTHSWPEIRRYAEVR